VQQQPEVVVGREQIGPERDRPAERLLRGLELAEPALRLAEIGEIRGVVGSQSRRPSEAPSGRLDPAPVHGQHAE
jgi:hypothetical protein